MAKQTCRHGYALSRREDPRLRARIHGSLGDARLVVNVGAGTGSYEPRDRHVVAIEPSDVMASQRSRDLAHEIHASAADAPPALAEYAFDSPTLHGGEHTRPCRVPLRRGRPRRGVGAGPPVETMSSAFANLVTKTAREDFGAPHAILVSLYGVSGTAYAGLKKGTPAYTNGLAQVTAARDLAKAGQKTYVVRAVTNVHGESDHLAANAAYAADLATWQADYDADVKALTVQTSSVSMLHSQISSWTTPRSSTTSAIPAAQLAAHGASGGKIVLVGAKYHLAYAADGLHLTHAGYRHVGEDYAKVYRRVVLEGKPWEPVRPKTITRNGAEVVVAFHVPVPPLVLDTTLVTDPGSFGFEVTKQGQPALAIASVTVTGPETGLRLVLPLRRST